MKYLKKISLVAAFCALLLGVSVSVGTARAEDRSLDKKWMLTAFYNCLRDENNIRNPIPIQKSGLVADSVFVGGTAVMPSEEYFIGITSDRSCEDIYKGFDAGGYSFSGIIGYIGYGKDNIASWSDDDLSKATDLLKKTGYSIDGDGYEIQISGTKATYRPAFEISPGNYSQETEPMETFVDGKNYVKLSENDFNISVNVKQKGSFTLSRKNIGSNVVSTESGGINVNLLSLGPREDSIKLSVYDSLESTVAELNRLIGQRSVIEANAAQASTGVALSVYTYQTVSSIDGTEFTFVGDPSVVAANAGGGSTISDFNMTEDERYDLYRYYFDKTVSNVTERANCDTDDLPDGAITVHLKNTSGKWASYYFDKNDVALDKSFNDIFGGSFRTITTQDIIDWFNEHEVETDECNDPDPPKDPSGGNVATEVDCYNAAAALGWILCPVIDFTQNTITAVYGSIVENFLEFRASWLDYNGEGKQVYAAWQTFQSFANIIFVIVLLVVIFSQLTGVGIDNLGIKRVLPKLIVAAILINLSYLICMLFVDISNILGVGLNDMFANIIVATENIPTSGAQALTTVVTGAVAAAVGFLALNPVSIGIFGSVIVVPLVLGLIATLVGVLFFFILLGARQAAIIMLIVVSPVAFACYMLPNTKTIFDRWLKMFEGLLLLFPICGLMMGGSAFASKVLMTVNDNFLGALIAMLIGVVPFFFIPTLLRGAFSAMGNLGARISGIGQNISRGLGRAAVGSDTMKDFQTRMRAGIDRNGNLTRAGEARMKIARGEGRLGKISALRQRVGRAQLRNLAAYEKMQDEVDLASRPDLYMREAETKRFNRRQAAADSELVVSGVANRTGDKKGFVAGQTTFDEGTLAYIAMQAARDGDVEMQYAATERMLAQGHHGAEAFRQVLASLEAQGNTAALENFAKAAKGSRNLGDLKSGARSTFDYVSAIANNEVTRDKDGKLLSAVASNHSLNDYTNNVKYSNMSESQIVGMDREELTRAAQIIQQKRNSGVGFTKEEEALISQANKAFRNERIRGSAKESNQILAADIAGISEEERKRILGERIDVDHENSNSNNSSTPTPAPAPAPTPYNAPTQGPEEGTPV